MAIEKKAAQNRKDIPLDSTQRPKRESLDDLQGRREHLSEEEEMIRRNQRSHWLRLKNRLKATSRR